MFKTAKQKKVGIIDNRMTLDAKHNDMIKYFKEIYRTLPEKEQKLEEMRKEYNKLKIIPKKDLENDMINERYTLKTDIEKLEKEIINIENKEEEKKYFLDSASLLYKYYGNIDSIASSEKIEKTYNVLDIMQQNSDSTPIVQQQKSDSQNKDMSYYVNTVENFQRAKLLNEYLKKVDSSYVNLNNFDNNYDICENCNIEKQLLPNDGIMVCNECGEIDFVVIDSDKPNYKDPPPEVSYFAYKRINHFNEWLSQIQGKELTEIEVDVFDKILLEIKKERITNMIDVSPKKVRGYLKKLGLNKYYEHTAHIICRLNGKQPPNISPEIEEKLRRMFKEIQEPFIQVCPKNRKNFLSYSYILHKFVELLGLDEYKELFPLLKSREKLHTMDILFSNICKILGWEFIKSI